MLPSQAWPVGQQGRFGGLVPFVLCVLVLGACDLTSPDDPSRISVHADRNVYRLGEEAVLTVRNDTPDAARFSDCDLRVVRASGAEWEFAGRLRPCGVAPPFRVDPATSLTLLVPVGGPVVNPDDGSPVAPSLLQPGHEYRIEVDIQAVASVVESLQRISTGPFSVVEWASGSAGSGGRVSEPGG